MEQGTGFVWGPLDHPWTADPSIPLREVTPDSGDIPHGPMLWPEAWLSSALGGLDRAYGNDVHRSQGQLSPEANAVLPYACSSGESGPNVRVIS